MKKIKGRDAFDAMLMQHVVYYTVIQPLGMGKSNRHEYKTLEEAKTTCLRLRIESTLPALVYAVCRYCEYDHTVFIKV